MCRVFRLMGLRPIMFLFPLLALALCPMRWLCRVLILNFGLWAMQGLSVDGASPHNVFVSTPCFGFVSNALALQDVVFEPRSPGDTGSFG